MKALTLTQPWATLVAIGAKRLETRSWPTAYRGPLAIHAAKGWTKADRDLCLTEPFKAALAPWYAEHNMLPRGVVIAICDITGCFATRDEDHSSIWIEYPGANLRLPPEEPEASFGNYAPGRFAFRLENVRRQAEPVPVRGMLGLWEWNDAAPQ